MPATPNYGQLGEVSFLDGLNTDGTVASASFAGWVRSSRPAYYNTSSTQERKWDNDVFGNPVAATARAGQGGGVITYTFDAAYPATAEQQAAFVAAFTLWADIANIGFVPAASAATADAVFSVKTSGGTYTTPAGAALATPGSATVPVVNAATGRAALVFDNGGNYGTIGSFTAAAGYGVSSMVHEFGHLIGLGHAGPYNGTVNPSTDQLGAYDSRQWSTMSYISPDDPTAKYFTSYPVGGTSWKVPRPGGTGVYTAAPETPMPLDILAAQQLYGVSGRTTFSGGQVFGFNCNIGDAARAFYDFTQNTTPVVTLYDTGGNNILDLSGFAANATVNLNPGTFSSAGGLTNNIGMAFNTVIDTATSGPGDDTFILNGDSDAVYGNGGTNTAILPGPHTQYTVVSTGTNRLLYNNVTHVTDTLNSIQVVIFTDERVILASPQSIAAADPLFDADFYLVNNPDVAAAGIDPWQHYLTRGWKEGRDPAALFSERYYLNQNPDVAAAGVNPLLHYATTGWREGRDPSSLFSTSAYLARNPDVAAAGVDPLLQYDRSGVLEGRAYSAARPHPVVAQDPLVSAALVYAERPDVVASGLDPTVWFHAYGWQDRTPPDALFDVNYYLQKNPDVAAAHIDPLTHYEQSGWKEGRNPSAAFSTRGYLSHDADVAASGLNPLVHYLQYGQAEGRTIYPA